MNLREVRGVQAGGALGTARPPARGAGRGLPRSRWRARRGRDARARETLSRARGVNSAHAVPARLSFCLSARGVSRKHTHLYGVPPTQGGLTSDPAGHEVFQLEAAHGRGCGAAPARDWVGTHSACARCVRGVCGAWPAGGAPGGGREPRSARGLAPQPGPRSVRAPRAARPQRALKAQQAGGHRTPQAPRCRCHPRVPNPTFSVHLSLASGRTLAP